MNVEKNSKIALNSAENKTRSSRSVHCNGRIIKHYREKCRCSQIELAERAGFGRRVIAKAEAGGPVERATIEAIAQAFTEAGHDVSAADLQADPEALTRRFLRNYIRYEVDCVQKSLDIVSPDIVAVIDGDPATNPIAGEYRGLAAFEEFWRKFFQLFVRDGGTLDDPQILAVGNDVIAWGKEYIRVREVPPQPAGFVMVRARFKDGLMVRFEDYYDEAGMMRVLRSWAEDYPAADWTEMLPKTTRAAEVRRSQPEEML
jgi:transcriptional regulator with XRE-family HTH domain